LDEGLLVTGDEPPDLVALDDALQVLERMDPRRSQVIELRFFGGLTVEETAVVLKVAPDTVMRDSRLAKAWLARELSGGKRHDA
jgi:DNA-directed RNA polymerase specialized sigma24 family protein